jgi:hypothetical protein
MVLPSVCLLMPIMGMGEIVTVMIRQVVLKLCCVTACRNGRLSVAKMLVAAGASVNELNYNNCTPLHCGVSSVSISLYLFPRFVIQRELVLCCYINAVCSVFN